jgi:hypothetical protein
MSDVHWIAEAITQPPASHARKDFGGEVERAARVFVVRIAQRSEVVLATSAPLSPCDKAREGFIVSAPSNE